MAQTPQRSPQRAPQRPSHHRPTDPTPLTGPRSGRPEPDDDEPIGAAEPEDEFDDEFPDEFDESDDAPVR